MGRRERRVGEGERRGRKEWMSRGEETGFDKRCANIIFFTSGVSVMITMGGAFPET